MDKALNRAILKVCSSRGNNNYRQKGDVQRVIYYVLQDNKRTNDKIWNSIGTYHKSKDGIIEDFLRIKRLYDKADGLQLKHLILSWGTRPDIPRKKLRKLISRLWAFGARITNWSMQYTRIANQINGMHILSSTPCQILAAKYR